jgi:DNA-binding NtrC family response regulator
MGGAETMQQIKSLYKGIKVFVSSGHATHPLVVDFARYGFCAAIAKPYDYDELEQILKQHLE